MARNVALKIGVLAAMLAWVYAAAFWWMADRWWAADSYYSHGPLIPLVSLYLLWSRRKSLAALPPATSGWGWVLILIGLILQIFSAIWRIYFSSALSLLMVLSGLVLAFGGTPLWKRTWFPILFLLFMVPMPLVLIAQISLQLKLWAAAASARIIWWMGIPVGQDGSMLYLPHGSVLVEDVCSGLRSLISLLALGVLCTYLSEGRLRKRILMLAASVPIALSANIFRIAVISLLSEVYGYQLATGTFHDMMGFVSFGLAYLLFMTLGAWLR